MAVQQLVHNTTIEHSEESKDRSLFGFWIYLMTDLIVFAALFAAYAVLRNSTFGGPSGKDIFNLPFVLVETLLLLTSSFICGLGMLAARQDKKQQTIWLLAVTCMLGIAFLAMELTEFSHLLSDGNSWQRSGFLSAFFTLVGTHGLHIATGLLWAGMLIISIATRGITAGNMRKVQLFSLFWHFLDIVWIFIFTFVYLMGGGL